MAQHQPTQEQIEARAYELYLQRGDQPGSAIADWLDAERQLVAEAAGDPQEPSRHFDGVLSRSARA